MRNEFIPLVVIGSAVIVYAVIFCIAAGLWRKNDST